MTIFSEFSPFLESFSKSVFIEDLTLEKFLLLAFIFLSLSPTSQIDWMSWSTGIWDSSLMDSSD